MYRQNEKLRQTQTGKRCSRGQKDEHEILKQLRKTQQILGVGDSTDREAGSLHEVKTIIRFNNSYNIQKNKSEL